MLLLLFLLLLLLLLLLPLRRRALMVRGSRTRRQQGASEVLRLSRRRARGWCWGSNKAGRMWTVTSGWEVRPRTNRVGATYGCSASSPSVGSRTTTSFPSSPSPHSRALNAPSSLPTSTSPTQQHGETATTRSSSLSSPPSSKLQPTRDRRRRRSCVSIRSSSSASPTATISTLSFTSLSCTCSGCDCWDSLRPSSFGSERRNEIPSPTRLFRCLRRCFKPCTPTPNIRKSSNRQVRTCGRSRLL
mmetsp:Transcript_11374/g.25913  ORF Transcript_11374/g.25913 Transcript_11374/m.25913 type:complete len:245 (-) Transcript_11374:1162-1896(-)